LRISEEQVKEWTQNPVTIALKDLCNQEIDRIATTPPSIMMVEGEPMKTHENIVELEARERCWIEWATFLEGDWEYLLEVDENE